ncbi:MAG: hypothetical protein K5886_13395 [Lachnospiraceae bacterium]|nr:hypothetical protein [Lachnospiraceae bacterium]
MKYGLIKKYLKSFTAGLAAFSLLIQSGTVYGEQLSWSGSTVISESTSVSGAAYSSSAADQNALLIDTSSGTEVTISNPEITKSGGTSNSDKYSFYGINSAVMCKGGGTTTINGGTVTTSAEGANGVFSYGANNGQTNSSGDGTTVNISGTVITTTGNGSGGIMTTYGGTTNAENLTIETSGGSSAPIRTDRGGGWVSVNGGSYTSNGLGSPAIYSTADVDVENATLISNKSEGVCIEGNGSIELKDCTLTADNTERNGNAQYYDSIMIYQSMSGDATGTGSEFSMTGGTLNSKNGHVFHVTNTSATINLTGVDINNEDSDGILLSVVNDGWSGNSNKATVNASSQTLEGDIIISSESSSKSSSKSGLTLNLKNGSSFTGKIDDGNGGSSFNNVTVNMESGSTWTLTGDSYVTAVNGEGTIDENGFTLTTGCGTNSQEEESSSENNGRPGPPPDGDNSERPELPPDWNNGEKPKLPPGENGGQPGFPTDGGITPGSAVSENSTSGTIKIGSSTYNYSYTDTISYNGKKLKLSDFTIDGKKAGATLSGNVIFKKLKYKKNKKAGKAYAIPVFKAASGADRSTKSAVKKANAYFRKNPLGFTVTPCSLTSENISGSAVYKQSSGKWKFNLKVDTGTSKLKKLKYKRDFKVTSGSYNAENATVQIEGKGNYTGTATVTSVSVK